MRIKLYPEYPEGVPALITEEQAAEMLAGYILADIETEIAALLVRPELSLDLIIENDSIVAGVIKDTFDVSTIDEGALDLDNWHVIGAGAPPDSVNALDTNRIVFKFDSLITGTAYDIHIMAETGAFAGKRVPSLMATTTIPATL